MRRVGFGAAAVCASAVAAGIIASAMSCQCWRRRRGHGPADNSSFDEHGASYCPMRNAVKSGPNCAPWHDRAWVAAGTWDRSVALPTPSRSTRSGSGGRRRTPRWRTPHRDIHGRPRHITAFGEVARTDPGSRPARRAGPSAPSPAPTQALVARWCQRGAVHCPTCPPHRNSRARAQRILLAVEGVAGFCARCSPDAGTVATTDGFLPSARVRRPAARVGGVRKVFQDPLTPHHRDVGRHNR